MNAVSSATREKSQRPEALPDCGQRISVESPRHTGKLWTQMVGHAPGRYLVFEKPAGADPTAGRAPFRDGDSLVIRFLRDGSIYGFRAAVLATLSFPYKLVFVSFPGSIERHSLRASPRLNCYVPCSGIVGVRGFSRGVIRDFSSSGCQLRIPLDALDDPPPEDEAEKVDGGVPGAVSGAAAGEEHTPREVGKGGVSDGGAAVSAQARQPDGGAGAPADGGAAAAESPDEQPRGPGQLSMTLQLPGDEDEPCLDGEVVEWQTLERYHLLRIRFDEPQQAVFDQLSVYTTQLET